jgi:hypothetical protein
MPHDRSVSGIDFDLPFTTALEGEQNLGWHDVVTSMLAVGYVWEAQSLLPICLRHAKSEDGTALLKILNAIPREDDTVYKLVRCTMLVEMSKFFASQSWQMFTQMELCKQWQEMVEGGLDPSCPMDSMLTPISKSRAYQEMELFRLKEKTEAHKNTFPHEADDTTPFDGAQDLQKIRAEAENRGDYMFVLTSYEQSEDSLPQEWLERTGTSQEALKYLHPNAEVSSRFPVQKQIIEQQITYADDKILNVRDVHHGSVSPDLAIPDRRVSPQGSLGPFSLPMQQRAQNPKPLPRSQREAMVKRLPGIGSADVEYHNLDPNDFVGYEDYDGYDDILPHVKPAKAGKSAKRGKNGKESSSKAKKTVMPVVSQYEGWMIAVLDKIQLGETPSWSKSRKTLLPFSTQELHDLATEHEKRSGNLSNQFRKLCTNQQQIVNRLIAEKNVEEQQANAEWVLLCVKKLHTEQRTAFRTYRINNGMQVIMHRQEKPKEFAESIQQEVVAVGDEDIVDLSKPVKSRKKETSPMAGKDGEKKVKGDKKKASKKEPLPQENYDDPWPDYMGKSNPFQPQQQQDPFSQHQQQQYQQ